MKQILSITVAALAALISGCGSSGDEINPLAGRVFRNISEIPELKDYTTGGGSVIEESRDADNNYKYGISYYFTDKNTVCILEEISKPDANGKVSYTILDTINIGPLSNSNALHLCRCRQDTIHDCKIIATYVVEEKEYFDRIVKAWRVNLTTKRIEKIQDTKGINCVNEGFGESEDASEINTPMKTDSTEIKDKNTPDSGGAN